MVEAGDEAIVDLLRAGREAEAFDALVPAFRKRVYGLAFSILRDRDAAEDVAQEVFVKLWNALGGYDGRAQLSTWIYAITRNAALTVIRRRRPEDSLSDPEVMDRAEAATPAADSAAGIEDAGLWRLVEALPDHQRRVVTLFYQEDRSVEEVAAMLGMAPNTVKTHLFRARARLAAALGVAKEDAA